MEFRTLNSKKRIRFNSPVGTKEVPVFKLSDDNIEVVVDKMTSLYDEIQSYKDEVLLDKLILRGQLSNTSMPAPENAFYDTTSLPKDLLELNQSVDFANSFLSSLSASDKILLNDKGFDAFLKHKFNEFNNNNSKESSDE